MAESRSMRQNDVVCRFFMSSFCRDGDNCLFSHDSTRAITVDNVCRYYLQGKCVFGNDCRYDHVQVNKLDNYIAHPHNDRHSAGPSRHSTNIDTSSNNTRSSFFSQDCERHFADSVCRYYLQGKCVFGKDCRYDHVQVNELDNFKAHPHNDRHSAGPSPHSTNIDASCNNTRYESRSSFSSQDYTCHSAGPVCRYYLQGKCVYGEYCRYDHAGVNNDGNSHSHNGDHSAGPSSDSINLGASSNYTRCKPNNQNTHQRKCFVQSQNTKGKKNVPHVKKKVQSKKDLEKDMALALAIQKSMDKTCGICMDVVVDKENFSERKFGILDKCNHVYCFGCISQWRKSKERVDSSLNSDVTKACPECRIVSDLVIPSEYFVGTEEEKEKLITEYKKVSSQNRCKCLKKGKGATCIFGESCPSLRAKPDRATVEYPLPFELIEDDSDDELDSIFDDLGRRLDDFVGDLYCVGYLDSDDCDYIDDE